MKSGSRPVWGAWIEIGAAVPERLGPHRRAPYGARGLKYAQALAQALGDGVAPRMGRVD